MNLIIYKHYSNINELQKEINNNANNGDITVAYLSGDSDIFSVLKELIKTEYKA